MSAAGHGRSAARSRRAYSVGIEVLERIEGHVRRYGLIEPGGEVTCLVSGGADSTCLWHALRELGYRVSALHVDHGLRGAESDGDARFCAEQLGAEVVRAHARGATEAELPSSPVRLRHRPPARDRPHRERPGRDDPLPPRRRAARRAGSSRGARTAWCGRSWRSGARRPRPTAASRGLDVPRRLVEPRHDARADPPRDRPAAPAPPPGRARERPARARGAADAAAGARGAPRRADRLEARRPRRTASRPCGSTTACGSSARRST